MLHYDNFGTPRVEIGGALWQFPITERNGFIGLDILPELPVGEETGKIPVIRRESNTLEDVKHADGAGVARGSFSAEDLEYVCEEYAFEQPLTRRKIKRYTNYFNAAMAAGKINYRRMALAQEVRHSELLFNTSTWTGASLYTDVTTVWSDVAADIIGDVQNALEKVEELTGLRPDTLFLSAVNRKYLRKNTVIQDAMKYTARLNFEDVMTALADLLDVKRILWGSAIYNGAKQGQTYSATRAWSASYAMVAVTAQDSQVDLQDEPHLGRTLKWQEMGPDMINTLSYGEPQTRSEVFQNWQNAVEKVFDPSFAHLMKID